MSGGGYKLPKGARVGLLANQASVSSSLDHTAGIIFRSDADLACLFGPQHGPSGVTQANMIEWEGYTDPQLGIPVYSLYGETRTPLHGMLEGLDIVVGEPGLSSGVAQRVVEPADLVHQPVLDRLAPGEDASAADGVEVFDAFAASGPDGQGEG